MAVIVNDRVFWIYFIVTLFFIIIGVGAILGSDDPHMIVIAVFWLLSSVALMIVVYHTSINWGPVNPESDTQICVIDANSGCFDAINRVWLFINVLFIVLLILATLWAGELGNQDGSPLRSMSGVLILLGGLILCGLAGGRLNAEDNHVIFDHKFVHDIHIIPFWVAVGYLIIWFGLTLYVVITVL